MPSDPQGTPPLPETVLIGKNDGMWPLQIFTNDDHAVIWLGEANEGRLDRRHVWRVRIEVLEEMDLVPPVPARLRAKSSRL